MKKPSKAKSLKPKQKALLKALSECGTILEAAAAAGVHRSSHYNWLEHETYAKAYEEALDEHTELLEKEAIRRAIEGTKRPIYHRGELVGHEPKTHDALLTLLLKARKPEKYRDNQQAIINSIPAYGCLHPEKTTEEKVAEMRAAMALMGLNPDNVVVAVEPNKTMVL